MAEKVETCPICHGDGDVKCPKPTGLYGTGLFGSHEKCAACHGRERVQCKRCGGSGKITVKRD